MICILLYKYFLIIDFYYYIQTKICIYYIKSLERKNNKEEKYIEGKHIKDIRNHVHDVGYVGNVFATVSHRRENRIYNFKEIIYTKYVLKKIGDNLLRSKEIEEIKVNKSERDI